MKTTYTVVKEGTGDAVVAKGSKVKVHATGTVVETEKKFWSTKDKGQQPFEYSAGVGGVIKGWDQGCLGMKVGEVRQLTIPADEGYGANGFPAWGIPPNGGLYFGARALCRARLGQHSTRTPRPRLSVSQCADRRSVPRRNRGAADQVSCACMVRFSGRCGITTRFGRIYMSLHLSRVSALSRGRAVTASCSTARARACGVWKKCFCVNFTHAFSNSNPRNSHLNTRVAPSLLSPRELLNPEDTPMSKSMCACANTAMCVRVWHRELC